MKNKLAKARKTRTSPGMVGFKKFGLGKLLVKKFSENTLKTLPEAQRTQGIEFKT